MHDRKVSVLAAFCYHIYMQTKLIIIRGNSGSGKSTVARLVREKLGDNTMLVPQDVVRREMLYVKDRVGNPAINLISKIALYGKEVGYNVVLEGILSEKLYGTMLNNLITEYNDNAYVFYMDISFNETLRRHDTKPNKHEFGEGKMKEWWLEKDYINLPNEYIIPEKYDVDATVEYILAFIG
jgi:predicted kinase